MGIGGAHIVAFLVAHLPLDSRLRPQPGLDQRTARHGSEPVAADIHLGAIAHRPERGIHRVLGIGFHGLASSAKPGRICRWSCGAAGARSLSVATRARHEVKDSDPE